MVVSCGWLNCEPKGGQCLSLARNRGSAGGDWGSHDFWSVAGLGGFEAKQSARCAGLGSQ